MLEVFTTGGGEYIVNVFNAVAAWTGGGGFRSLLRVVMVMGLIYALLVVAFSMNWRAWLHWFLGATLMYGALIVPTTSVKVTDRLNPSLAPATVANVPIGLAAIASVSSTAGDWLTRTAETVFVMPASLQLSNNGMIYGARLWDKTREYQIRDPRVRANTTEYFKQCLFYDIMLGHENFADLANSNDIMTEMGDGSPARGMRWLNASGASTFVTCQTAYGYLKNTDLPAETAAQLTREGKRSFPGLSDAAARAKLEADLPVIGAAFHGSSQTASQIFQQRALTDAFLEARANLSGADGDTFAMLRAEEQARNTYSSIAQQAMTWVPLLNIVLTVVFYAMFPVIFPLFLFPKTGVTAVKGYFTGFFYLAAWGPLYAVLHMFIMDRTADAMNAAAPGGITMAGMAGIDAVNQDTATIAGFLMMSIPFLAAGMARGAMAVSTQATSMLAPAQSAAEAAAVERTTGNYAYGNLSYQNETGNVVQRNQWNTAPSFSGGFATSHFRRDDGIDKYGFADGGEAYDAGRAIGRLANTPTASSGFGAEVRGVLAQGYNHVQQVRHEESISAAATESRGNDLISAVEQSRSSGSQTGSGVSSSLANVYEASNGLSNNLQTQFGLQQQDSDNISRSSILSGNASASLGTPGGALNPAQLRLGAQVAANAQRATGRTITAEEGFRELYGYVEQQSSSMRAQQVRDDFARTTAGSQDSEVQRASERWSTSLSETRTASVASSNAEDNYERVSRDVSNWESEGFTINRDLSREFTDFETAELAKPENRILADTGLRPGMVVQNAQQAAAESILMQRFSEQRLDQIRDELGVVPEAPSVGLARPGVGGQAGVIDWVTERSGAVRGAGPDVDVRSAAGNESLRKDVEGRISGGDDYVLEGGRQIRSEGVPRYRQARNVRDTVDNRNHATLGETMPIVDRTVAPVVGGVIDAARGAFGKGEGGPGGSPDTFPGGQGSQWARELGLPVKAGARIDNLDRSMYPAMSAVSEESRRLGISPRTVTSGNDSRHVSGSQHYENRALDFRGRDLTVEQGRALARGVQSRLGSGYFVDFEVFPDNPGNNHLHIQRRRGR
ncbi:conjugal transfer protein TraG N-terminal domain-containing protein [Croceicoccus mobilis]|uniref:TraG N-terminal Proteobacteria domain-containing protein n=1 Tax=Croceicoccus mobilis TaxID=1703339 RepID=A0A916ZA18_9SPHN|nr:conjugal transfer protein TraG N-terminal domain-containing protein [Croceicoccus mobilis]GGD82085.1 hypothetical protein GCM10010990_35050 [Croceicoccus mobilis]